MAHPHQLSWKTCWRSWRLQSKCGSYSLSNTTSKRCFKICGGLGKPLTWWNCFISLNTRNTPRHIFFNDDIIILRSKSSCVYKYNNLWPWQPTCSTSPQHKYVKLNMFSTFFQEWNTSEVTLRWQKVKLPWIPALLLTSISEREGHSLRWTGGYLAAPQRIWIFCTPETLRQDKHCTTCLHDMWQTAQLCWSYLHKTERRKAAPAEHYWMISMWWAVLHLQIWRHFASGNTVLQSIFSIKNT